MSGGFSRILLEHRHCSQAGRSRSYSLRATRHSASQFDNLVGALIPPMHRPTHHGSAIKRHLEPVALSTAIVRLMRAAPDGIYPETRCGHGIGHAEGAPFVTASTLRSITIQRVAAQILLMTRYGKSQVPTMVEWSKTESGRHPAQKKPEQ